MSLPAANYLANAGRTEGEMKQALEDWLAGTKKLPGGAAEYPLLIQTGAITPTVSEHAVDTQGGAASDDLSNIVQDNLDDGSMLFLHIVTASRTVTVKHAAGGAGQISLAAGHDKVLRRSTDWLLLKRTGTLWEEVLTSGSGAPTGALMAWPLASPPVDWLIADGSAVSRTTYAALFEAIGTTFGVGDGSTTFNLPNCKGRVLVGYDAAQTEFNALGKVGGEKVHTLTIQELPVVTPTINDPGHSNPIPSGSGGVGGQQRFVFGAASDTGTSPSASATTGITVNPFGGGQPHNTLGPYFTANVIIKT